MMRWCAPLLVLVAGPILLATRVATTHSVVPVNSSTRQTVQVTAQSDTAMTLRFTRETGEDESWTFARGGQPLVWSAPSEPSALQPLSGKGVIFGRSRLKFATGAALQAMGVSPHDSLRPLAVEIIGRPYDDISVVRTDGGELALCLWNKGLITEIWMSGSMLPAAMAILADHASACMALLELCCQTSEIPVDGGVQVLPNPHIDACNSVAANCPDQREAACACLFAACDICGGAPCPSGSEREVIRIKALLSAVRSCGDVQANPIPPQEWSVQVLDLLREILERLQRIRDTTPSPQ